MKKATNIPQSMLTAGPLMLGLLTGFYWFDEGLQNYLRSRGWPHVSRPQSMIMANIVMGVTSPSEIARRLGISRQAIYNTLKTMIEMDMIELVDDPGSGRNKIVRETATGEAMRADAQDALILMQTALQERLGKQAVTDAINAMNRDWGPPLTFPKADSDKA